MATEPGTFKGIKGYITPWVDCSGCPCFNNEGPNEFCSLGFSVQEVEVVKKQGDHSSMRWMSCTCGLVKIETKSNVYLPKVSKEIPIDY